MAAPLIYELISRCRADLKQRILFNVSENEFFFAIDSDTALQKICNHTPAVAVQ
jgi:hypothetical protein